MLLRATWASGFSLALLLGCGACDGDDGPDGEPDAGTDAGFDAGTDAGFDAGFDGGSDGGADTGTDSGAGRSGPYPEAGWVPLEGLPPGCLVERAEHPERVFEPVWVDCPGDLPACEMLSFDDEQRRYFGVGIGAHDGERGYFGFHIRYSVDPWILVLGTTTGIPLGAWRTDNPADPDACTIGQYALSSTAAALWPHAYTDPPAEAVLHAVLEEIGTLDRPTATITSETLRGSITQKLSVSDVAVAAELQPAGHVILVRGSEVRDIAPTGEVSGNPQGPQLVGEHVLWLDWVRRGDVSLAHATMTEGPGIYLEVPGGSVLAASTDGEDLAWLQAYDSIPGDEYERIELWASPHADEPAGLRPRMVAEVDTVGALHSGVYAAVRFRDGRWQVVMHDISDGRTRLLVLPEGWGVSASVLYLSAEELLVGVTIPGSGRTAVRVPLSAIPYEP